MGAETVINSHQPISYGFISLFFFPIILGASVYSLSKYDEYLTGKPIINTVETNQLAITSPISINKKPAKNRSQENLLGQFILDSVTLFKENSNQAETISNTHKLLKFGAISLLAIAGASLAALDAIKNTSSTIPPAQLESLTDMENINISSDKNSDGIQVKEIRYISSSLGTNNIKNKNTFKAYRISNRSYAQEVFAKIILS